MLDTTVRWFVTITFHSPVNTFLIGTVMLWLGVMTCSRVRCIITCTKVNVLLNGSQMFKLLVKWSGHTFPHVYRNAVCTTAITDSSPKPNGSFHQHQECFPPLLTSETFGLLPHTHDPSQFCYWSIFHKCLSVRHTSLHQIVSCGFDWQCCRRSD